MRALIALSLVLVGASARASACSDDEVCADAQAAFRQGVLNKNKLLQARQDFRKATDAYLELHWRGIRNPALYRNLGNAAVLADRWPEAIWAYHMGLKLDPNHADLREHLARVRGKILYPTGGQGRLDADTWPLWLHCPTPFELSLVFAFSYALVWLAGACAVFTRKVWIMMLTIVLVSIAIVSAAALRLESERAETDRRAPLVIIADNTPFYLGNGPSYEQHKGVPLLPRGLEARLIHRRGDWVQIRLSTGEIGWLPRNQVLIVAPRIE
jgi:hypothetical protein